MKEEWIFHPDQGLSHSLRRAEDEEWEYGHNGLDLGHFFQAAQRIKVPKCNVPRENGKWWS